MHYMWGGAVKIWSYLNYGLHSTSKLHYKNECLLCTRRVGKRRGSCDVDNCGRLDYLYEDHTSVEKLDEYLHSKSYFEFHMFLLSTETSFSAIASYKYFTENLSFYCKLHGNSSGSFDNKLGSRCVRNLFHTTRQCPSRSLGKDIGVCFTQDLCDCAIPTKLCLTIRHRLGYCTVSEVSPCQVSFQNVKANTDIAMISAADWHCLARLTVHWITNT
jgi:hypothetical protein